MVRTSHRPSHFRLAPLTADHIASAILAEILDVWQMYHRRKGSKKFINELSVDKSSISSLIGDLTKLKTKMTELEME